MPGNPASLKLYGLVDTKFLFDFYSMSGYCIVSMLGTTAGSDAGRIFDGLAENMFKGRKHIPFKAVTQDGVSGGEYLQALDGMAMRVQLYMRAHRIYGDGVWAQVGFAGRRRRQPVF